MMPPHLVVIGASLGGLEALRALLGALPANFPAAVVIVQHRHKEESGELDMLLGQVGQVSVGIPLDKESIQAGRAYIAPPNYHMLVEDDHFAFSLDAPENYARPSIDVLFESAADACGADVTGIVLTGMRNDGARGLAAIRRRGGVAIVQSPSEAVAPEMPQAALAAVPDARQMTLKEIGAWLAGMRNDGARGLAAIRRRGGVAIVQSPSEAVAPEMPQAALAAVPDARQMTLKEIGAWLAGMR